MPDNLLSIPRVLIVDDMAQNVAILGRLLKKDYEVLVATSGKEALRQVRGGAPPDLILLDVMMPGMDGYEVCKRLKEDPETADIPVIFITAMTSMDEEAYGLKLGAVDYIFKPYQMPVIRARVNNQIELLRARRTAEIAHGKLSRELEAMNDLQKNILPTGEFRSGELFAQGIYIPSGLASGDYFDYLPTPDGGLRCVVADVSGHGARAAFIMANVRAVFHFEQTRNLAPSELINTLNQQLMETLGDEGDFVTIFVADINREKDRIEYVNAGHCPVFFRDDQGFREIDATESIVGAFEADFKSKVMDTHGDWQLLIYTDGIYECTVDGSEIFGYNAFKDLCCQIFEDGDFQVTSLPGRVKDAANGEVDIADDQTALYVKRVSSL